MNPKKPVFKPYAPEYDMAAFFAAQRILPKDPVYDTLTPVALKAAEAAIDRLDAGFKAHRAGPATTPGTLIRILRRGSAMTQAELASRAAIRQATLSAIERGHGDPRWSVVAKLLDALGVEPVLHAHDLGRYRYRCLPDE